MAVDVSRIPNNNKFDPVREAILQLQTEIEDTGNTIGNGTLTISTSSPLTGSGTFTANQTGPTSISIGIDGAEYLTNITHDTVNQKLVVTYGDGTTADLSLAQYIDDTNLARLVSGSLDSQTGIATFTRDDATTFTVDLSALFDDTDTNDFLTSASFSTANGIITFGVTNQTSVTVDIDGRYPLIGDLTAVSNDIITSADFSATDNRFKLTLTQADAGTIEASFDDVVLSESMAANYVPYVKVGGGDGDTTNAILNDSFLKINGSTLELDWGDTVGVYTARDIKMRKDGGGFGTYYEATYAADSVSFLHYASASDIDTAKIGATTTGRVRINDTYSLPVGDGTSGQVLSTNGSGDLSWVAAGGPTTSDLQDVTDNGATTTNSITVGGLTTSGTITGATARFTATSGHAFGDTVGTSRVVSFLNSGLADDSNMYLTIGKSESANNQGEISFYYASSGSGGNLLRLGLYGIPNAVTINGNGHLSVTSGNLAVETGVIKIGATTVIDASRNLTNMGAGSFGGNVTFGGYIDVGSTLYSRSNLEVLNAAGTGWNRWATRSNGQYNLDIGSLDVDGTATFNSVAVFKGQVSNYDGSTGRTSYWNYDDKVAAVFEPAADDGAVAILFPSIGNTPSDFGYIVFDEDYGEAGVTAGENSALIIGCENDGLNSSDHVRVKGRLVVEADMSSSDPTNAFQVKDGNVTSDLFRVARSGASVFSSTLNVADRLTVDDAIRLTSNPTITGDSSGVYFWNQAGVGATIASNAFEVRTNGNTTAFSIDNSQVATIHNELRTNGNILVGGNSSLRHPALDRFVNVQSTTNGAIIGYNLAVIDGANNRRGSFFMDDSAGIYGIDHTYSSGSMDFVIRVAGGELMRVLSNGIVSIGTPTPVSDAKLVVKDGNTYLEFSCDNAVADTARLLSYDRDNTAFKDLQLRGANVTINNASGEIVRVNSSGNVGIGVNPSYKLEVAGQAHIQGILSVSQGQQIRIAGASDGNHFLRKIATGYSGVTIDGPQLQGHQGGELTTNYTGDNWALRWAIGGKVYVNSTLDIGGGEAIHFTNTGTGTYNKTVIYQDSGNGFYVDAARATDSGSAARLPMTFTWRGGYASNGGLILNGTTKLYTTDTGLGIGTTSPSTKLQVGDGSSDDAIRAVFSDGNYTEMHGYGVVFSRGSSYIRPTTTGKNLIIGNASTAQQWANVRSYAIEHTWYSNLSASMFLNSSGYLGVGETNPQQRLHVNGVMRWGSSSYYAYSGVDGGGLYIEQVDNNTGRDRIRLQTRTNNSGTYTSFLIDAGDDMFQFANGDINLGREFGVTQLHNNKDYNNMASGLVWREYNATGTYVHATSSTTLSDYIKSYNFTEQGIATTVDSFTRSDDTYAVEFVGYYYANVDGVHEFSASSDDSSDFFIDGTRVGYWYGGHGDNNAPTGGTGQVAGSIYLVKGFHRLYARFQEGTGGDSISLWQKEPSGSWEKIPSTRFYHKAEDLFRATGSGNATLYGTFTATADIVAYSDERIKENVETIDNALDKVQQLRGVSFNRIKDGSKSIGVIAQEIEKVLPEVVTEDDKGIKGVAYGNVVGVLIEAIKEQQKQIDELKARLDGSTY